MRVPLIGCPSDGEPNTVFEALGNIGDFIGGIGVVVTLIHLVVQIRRNTRQLELNPERVRASAELDGARVMADWHGSASSPSSRARGSSSGCST